jgi:hypothetical protein
MCAVDCEVTSKTLNLILGQLNDALFNWISNVLWGEFCNALKRIKVKSVMDPFSVMQLQRMLRETEEKQSRISVRTTEPGIYRQWNRTFTSILTVGGSFLLLALCQGLSLRNDFPFIKLLLMPENDFYTSPPPPPESQSKSEPFVCLFVCLVCKYDVETERKTSDIWSPFRKSLRDVSLHTIMAGGVTPLINQPRRSECGLG